MDVSSFYSLVDSFILLYPGQKKLMKFKEYGNAGQVMKYKVEKESFNSEYSEFGPVIWRQFLVYTSSKPSGKKNDPSTGQSFVQLNMTDTLTGMPSVFKMEDSYKFNVGSCIFYDEGRKILFTANEKADKSKRGYHLLKLYTSQWRDSMWSSPEELDFNFAESNNMHPAISPNGQRIVFAADNYTGSSLDLYQTQKLKNGTWSRPTRLPAHINSKGNEVFPFFISDTILVYSSNGYMEGFGGLDFYKVTFKNKKWGLPEKLPQPFNSEKDDFGFWSYPDFKLGYFSSNRDSDDGNENIYRFHFSAEKIFIAESENDTTQVEISAFIRLLDEETFMPLSGYQITLTDIKTGESKEVTTNNNGFVEVSIIPDNPIIIEALMTGYLPYSGTIDFNSDKDRNYSKDIHLSPIKKDQIIVLENIYFDFDQWELTEESVEGLLRAVNILKQHPGMTIEIRSHTDVRGKPIYNQVLSEKRARSVYQFFVKSGIDASRMEYKGYGATQLINHCLKKVKCTEEEHRENRRTELRIISL
jgi:outer membrane protein OmpA-like peptidoglycan-associated protein